MKPKLYIFTISHFCEKARWALDYMGVDYQLVVIAPGSHLQVAKKLGLKRGSTPFLETSDAVIQGSNAIIDWAETQATKHTLTHEKTEQSARNISTRLDEKLGVHIRRWFYSEAIVEHPSLVKPIFLKDISVWEKLKFSIKWPAIQKLMIKGMDLGAEQGKESFEIVKDEMTWLESLLGNQPFLAGDTLSRADITAAALIAPMIKPSQHPTAKFIALPPQVKQQSDELKNNVVWSWVESIYRNHRV